MQLVIARAAGDDIVARTREHHVVARAGIDRVVTGEENVVRPDLLAGGCKPRRRGVRREQHAA